MQDNDVRLTQLYVAPTGSTVPNNAPNSADSPLPSFDVVITGERGDLDIPPEAGTVYTLRYDACDLTICDAAPAAFNNSVVQDFTNTALWTPIPPNGAQEDSITIQSFTIDLQGLQRAVSGHIFQYTASLIAGNGNIVSFLVSEPFILV